MCVLELSAIAKIKTMEYIKISWTNSSKSDPDIIYSELNSVRFETRKIELLSDGSLIGYATESNCVGPTALGIEAIPDVEDYNRLNSFEDKWGEKLIAEIIGQTDFERVWSEYVG